MPSRPLFVYLVNSEKLWISGVKVKHWHKFVREITNEDNPWSEHLHLIISNTFDLIQGIGVSMALISIIVAIYYNIIMAYTLYYFFATMQTTLPWTTCPDVREFFFNLFLFI